MGQMTDAAETGFSAETLMKHSYLMKNQAKQPLKKKIFKVKLHSLSI